MPWNVFISKRPFCGLGNINKRGSLVELLNAWLLEANGFAITWPQCGTNVAIGSS